jgi:hypothetical protein
MRTPGANLKHKRTFSRRHALEKTPRRATTLGTGI